MNLRASFREEHTLIDAGTSSLCKACVHFKDGACVMAEKKPKLMQITYQGETGGRATLEDCNFYRQPILRSLTAAPQLIT